MKQTTFIFTLSVIFIISLQVKPMQGQDTQAFIKKVPTIEQLNQWEEPATYGIWLDGQKIENETLAKMKPEDFGYYFVSKLMRNAVNFGNHDFQVDLYTEGYYEKYLKDRNLSSFEELLKSGVVVKKSE